MLNGISRTIRSQQSSACLCNHIIVFVDLQTSLGSQASQVVHMRSIRLYDGSRTICLIHAFGSLLERTRHGIKRILKLGAHEEPNHIRKQAPQKFPRLIYSPPLSRPIVSQNLPAFRIDQPTRGCCEAPRKPEAHAVDMSQNLLRRGPFRARVIHRGRHVES
jgi:hypothetical protein